jgi:hypothetical protein
VSGESFISSPIRAPISLWYWFQSIIMVFLLFCESGIERDYTLHLCECDIFSSSPEPAGLFGDCSGAARPFLVRQ